MGFLSKITADSKETFKAMSLSDLGSLRGGIPPHLCGGCRTPQELASYHGSM
jgi:hypothetical protein